MAAALPSVEEFVAGLSPFTEDIPVNIYVLQAAMIVGAKITIDVSGIKSQHIPDAAVLGTHVMNFLKLQKFCQEKNIILANTDIGTIIGGFTASVKISLETCSFPFDMTKYSEIHKNSQAAAGFTVLVNALSGKSIDLESIVIESFKLQNFGIPALVSADAIIISQPKQHEAVVTTYHPFDRQVAVSPFLPRSIVPSPVPFLDVAKANLTVPQSAEPQTVSVREIEEDDDDDEEDEEDITVPEEPPFTDVVSRRRHFVGAGPAPISVPVGSTYNKNKTSGKICPFNVFFERGKGRGRKDNEIVTDYAKFVLDNHFKLAHANKKKPEDSSQYENPQLYEEFRAYMEKQLGKDFQTLGKFIPV